MNEAIKKVIGNEGAGAVDASSLLPEVLKIIEQGSIERQVARLFRTHGFDANTAYTTLSQASMPDYFTTAVRNDVASIDQGMNDGHYTDLGRAVKSFLRRQK